MNRYCLFLLGALLAVCQAAFALEELAVIYNGENQLPRRVSMGFWGYRPVNEAEGNPFKPLRLTPSRKIYALKVATLGRYQGTRFDFAEPLDIASAINEKGVYLEMYLRAPLQHTVVAPSPAGPPPAPGEGAGGEKVPFPAELLEALESKPLTVPLPNVKNLRFILTTEKGESLLVVPAEQFYPKDEIDRIWVRVGIPLSLISKDASLGRKLSRIVISSDNPAEFLIGRMAIVRDTDPLTVNMFLQPPFLEAKQPIYLAARVEAGMTPFEIQWDFDAAAGKSVDAVGDRVTYTYAAEGLYTITCTVRDLTGAKDPVSTSIEVKLTRPWED